MHPVAEALVAVDGVDDVAREVRRVRRREADAADSRQLAYLVKQAGERPPARGRVPVAVDGLAQQSDFCEAPRREVPGFPHD